MANPRALTLQHRRELQKLAQAVGRQVRGIAGRADITAIADWWAAGADRQVEQVVMAGWRAATVMGARYLRAHAAASGATVDPVTPRFDLDAARASLFATSVGAFMTSLRSHGPGSEIAAHRSMMSQLVGSAQRLVLSGSRGTVLETFAEGR